MELEFLASCYNITGMAFPEPHHNHAKCTADLISRAERTCERRGSRLTGQRRDILNCVAQNHSAMGAYEIIARMAERGTRPAPITVYRALEFLLAHGLVHKIESRNAFVACSHAHDGEPAAMLICEGCGLVAEADVPDALASLKSAARDQGFSARQTMVEISGMCSSCARAA